MGRNDRMNDLIDLVPAREEGGFVGADRLRHIAMNIAVAEMTEGQWPRAGNEGRDGGIGFTDGKWALQQPAPIRRA